MRSVLISETCSMWTARDGDHWSDRLLTPAAARGGELPTIRLGIEFGGEPLDQILDARRLRRGPPYQMPGERADVSVNEGSRFFYPR